MMWKNIVNFFSGIYFVVYTASIVSFEYARYTVARYIQPVVDIINEEACKNEKKSQKHDELFVTMIKNIAIRLSKKNVYYTKLFQAIAYSADIYDDELASFFIQYTDKVDYDKTEYSNQHLNELILYADERGYTLTIDRPRDDDNMDPDTYVYTPSKTGSVSLIFYGTITKRTASSDSAAVPKPVPVVIKYLRTNMLERIQKSINDFKYMVALLDLFPRFKHLHLNDIFNEQRVMMLSQVNFHTEVENILKMYNNYEKTKTTFVKIPVVYPEFTNKFDDVIIMERISGKKLEELPYDEMDEYCGVVAKGLIKSVFLDGFYHCDMHPGNILFMECENESGHGAPCRRVGIFDFGIMGDMSIHEQNLSFALFKCILRKEAVEAARIIIDDYTEPYDATRKKTEFNLDGAHKEIEDLVTSILKNAQLTCFSAKDLCQLNYALLKYNLKISGSLTKIEISLSVCDNLCKKLAVHRSYMSYLKDLVDEIFE